MCPADTLQTEISCLRRVGVDLRCLKGSPGHVLGDGGSPEFDWIPLLSDPSQSAVDTLDRSSASGEKSTMNSKALIAATRRAKTLFLSALIVSLGACASVPKESVELSYLIGRDLRALQQSYDQMIVQRFADYRAQRNDYVDNVWAPAFIADWIRDGRLVDTARGVVVYDENRDDFVAPTQGQEQQQLLSTVYMWSDAAIFEISQKRARLLGPLDEDERRIRAEAQAAFDQVIQANAYVTAHLSSIRKVQELQDQALEALGVDDVVASLNVRLAQVSESARDGLERIREADGHLDRAIEIRSQIEGND